MDTQVKMKSATVTMEVTATVHWPVGVALSESEIIDNAMQSVTPFQEVRCCDHSKTWAKVFAEVSDRDCELHS